MKSKLSKNKLKFHPIVSYLWIFLSCNYISPRKCRPSCTPALFRPNLFLWKQTIQTPDQYAFNDSLIWVHIVCNRGHVGTKANKDQDWWPKGENKCNLICQTQQSKMNVAIWVVSCIFELKVDIMICTLKTFQYIIIILWRCFCKSMPLNNKERMRNIQKQPIYTLNTQEVFLSF